MICLLFFVVGIIAGWFFNWLYYRKSSKNQKKEFEQQTEEHALMLRVLKEAKETGFNRDSQNKIIEIVKRAEGKSVVSGKGVIKSTGMKVAMGKSVVSGRGDVKSTGMKGSKNDNEPQM